MNGDPPDEFDWGPGWLPVRDRGSLQAELDRELHPRHPLYGLSAVVFGRCTACDDVVASAPSAGGESEVAVIHLTWSGRSEPPTPDKAARPYFERLTRERFVTRFLRGGEHL